jgi:hypothetical protein
LRAIPQPEYSDDLRVWHVAFGRQKAQAVCFSQQIIWQHLLCGGVGCGADLDLQGLAMPGTIRVNDRPALG